MAMNIKITMLWHITLYVPVNKYHRFEGICCLCHHGIRTSIGTPVKKHPEPRSHLKKYISWKWFINIRVCLDEILGLEYQVIYSTKLLHYWVYNLYRPLVAMEVNGMSVKSIGTDQINLWLSNRQKKSMQIYHRDLSCADSGCIALIKEASFIHIYITIL
jgi:hypothetical protein